MSKTNEYARTPLMTGMHVCHAPLVERQSRTAVTRPHGANLCVGAGSARARAMDPLSTLACATGLFTLSDTQLPRQEGAGLVQRVWSLLAG